MAGTRQPIELIVANGRKHLTKGEIEARRESEVKASSDSISAPKYLSKALKTEFTKIADELIAIGIMTNLDVDALARFVIARKMYNDITKKILADNDKLLNINILNNQDKLFKQCRSAAMDLGLTISSRCRLVLPKPKEEKEPNKFARFGQK